MVLGLVACTAIGASALAAGAQSQAPLEPADLLGVRDITSVQLSPDGSEVVYVVREPHLGENRYAETIWRMPAAGARPPRRLTDSEKDSAPQWSPSGDRIGLLSTRDGVRQVWVLDVASGAVQKVTSAAAGVRSYTWSPDGRHIAFIAASAKGVGATVDNRRAAVIDKREFVVYRLLRNQLFEEQAERPHLWTVDLSSRTARQLTHDVRVISSRWAPDSKSIIATVTPDLPQYATASSVLRVTLDGTVTTVLQGERGDDWNRAIAFADAGASPDGTHLLIRRSVRADRWSALDDLQILAGDSGRPKPLTSGADLELYGAELHWARPEEIVLENAIRGNRGLFTISVANGTTKPLMWSDTEDSSAFSFSRDGRVAAFVRQSHQRAPEVYVARAPFTSAQKLTSINEQLNARQLAPTRRVTWMAPDGVRVEGWLYEPEARDPATPPPLLVFVHGGPSVAIGSRFVPYPWPYPFHLFAARGYRVFLPNYRGTGSYGKRFREPTDNASEPVTDILSGIESLIAANLAARDRIGIMGQSHGFWLGALVMTRQPIFKAASLAEGSGNMITTYGQMPGWLNLNVHEYYGGSVPYLDPGPWLRHSPVFALENVTTPTLLEFGDQSLAVQGLEFMSALWRLGIPHELVVYPETGHNIAAPALELEAMQRNLDWFDYWMAGRKDPSLKKQEQYARWERNRVEMEKMRGRKAQASPTLKRGR